MIMFKKISCVVFGAIAASLISAVEPAQAFSIRSSSSSYISSPTSSSYSSFNSSSVGYGQSSFSPKSSNLLAQGAQISDSGEDWISYAVMLPLLAWLIAEGLDTTSNNEEPITVMGTSIVNVIPPSGNGGGNGGGNEDGNDDGNPPPVPSPALLPGLIGMGVAAIRKRNRIEADQA